jgi:hypothetical protein
MPDSSPDSAVTAENELLGTTPDTATPAAAEAQQTDANTPASPPATAGTMLDAVQAALEPKVASPAPKEPDQGEEPDPDAKPAEGDEAEELSAEELKALSWKTQQRFKKLSSTVKDARAEVDALKPKAVEYDRMVGAIQRAGIDNRELDELVEVGGMLKSNPRAAYEKIMPIVRALEGVIGEVLTPELQEQVRLGYITQEHARELQRSRATATLSSQRAEQSEAQRKEEREAQERQTLVNSSIEAAELWDKQQAKDPDWHLKRKEVAEQVELAIVRKSNELRKPYFPTVKEFTALANEAKKTVEDRLKRFKPPLKEIIPATPSASTRSKPAAKTTLDAINNAL